MSLECCCSMHHWRSCDELWGKQKVSLICAAKKLKLVQENISKHLHRLNLMKRDDVFCVNSFFSFSSLMLPQLHPKFLLEQLSSVVCLGDVWCIWVVSRLMLMLRRRRQSEICINFYISCSLFTSHSIFKWDDSKLKTKRKTYSHHKIAILSCLNEEALNNIFDVILLNEKYRSSVSHWDVYSICYDFFIFKLDAVVRQRVLDVWALQNCKIAFCRCCWWMKLQLSISRS